MTRLRHHPPVTSAVAARLAGQSADALVVPGVSLAPQGVFTAFAIGGKTGASDNGKFWPSCRRRSRISCPRPHHELRTLVLVHRGCVTRVRANNRRTRR